MFRFIAVFSMILLVGCSSSPSSVSNTPQTTAKKSLLVDQYFIGVDDVVAVNVWKEEGLSITVPVRPDGRISVPLAGEILAGGRTPIEVAQTITQKLSKYIRDPIVTVILSELRSHEYLSRIRITGAVRTPVSINFRQGMTVLDVVLAAGGLNEFASANNTKLFRKIDGKLEHINIDLADILFEGNMSTNINMQPGDILSVPERSF